MSQSMPTSSSGSRFSLRTFLLGVTAAILCVWLGVGATLLIMFGMKQFGGDTSTTLAPAKDGNSLATPEEATVSAVAEKVSPSVVSITTEAAGRSDFWGRQQVQSGAGSGIIVGKGGLILTNKHVVDQAETVQVVLSDGTSYDSVRVVATDPLNDIAFLRLSGVRDLPVAALGNSKSIKIGQHVVAIGNSLGQYQNTVTSGIISGIGRPVTAQGGGGTLENLTDLLQTDAAINPGNSGGPLLNAAGQVIGVNTAVAAGAEGVGFAIPIDAVKGYMKQIEQGKTPQRAYLGVRYVPVDGALAREQKLSVTQGAYVVSQGGESAVVSGSPADKAGLRQGDVITKVGDTSVGAGTSVASLIAEYAPGDEVQLTVQRGERQLTLKVTLGAYRN